MNMGMQLLNFYGEKSKGPLNMYWLEQNFAFYSPLPRTWSSKRSALLALAECLLAIGFSGVRWSTCCFKNKMRSLRPLFLSKSNNSHLRCRYYKLRKTYILTSGLNILSRMTLCTVWYAKIHSNHLLVASPDVPQMASWTLKPARPPVNTCLQHAGRARGFLMYCRNVLYYKTTSTLDKTTECERQYWESWRGAHCLRWDQHVVGFLPEGDRAAQTLSEMSRPRKRLFVPGWLQSAQDKEQTSMFGSRSVNTDSECVFWGKRLYVIVSMNRDILFLLFACLAACANVEKVSVCGEAFILCSCAVQLLQRTMMGWEKHEEQPCALQKQGNAFDKDTAAS